MAASKEEQRDFIRKYKSAAETASKILFIPADVLLTQWAKEADWGKKESGNFNFAGIKSFNPNEPRKAVQTWEVLTPDQVQKLKAQGKEVTPRPGVKNGYNIVDYFKSYESPEDFAKEYSKTLIQSYPQAVGSENVEDFSYAIDSGRAQGKESGFKVYATDPNYAKSLKEIYKYNVIPRKNEIIDEDMGILRPPNKGDVKTAKKIQEQLGFSGKDVDGVFGKQSLTRLKEYNDNKREIARLANRYPAPVQQPTVESLIPSAQAAEMQPEPEGMPSPYEQPMQFPSQDMSPLTRVAESFIPSAQAQPAPQAQPTYDYIPQQPVPYTPSAPMSDFEQPQYATMEDLLADRGLMGTRGL